mmetsp:Transcript_4685/g.9032  ORF Transcript_4685/g.9032 Transcript_4685/m.9032 type:complete len:297 (+) Transcript_4685:228-1118(+)
MAFVEVDGDIEDFRNMSAEEKKPPGIKKSSNQLVITSWTAVLSFNPCRKCDILVLSWRSTDIVCCNLHYCFHRRILILHLARALVHLPQRHGLQRALVHLRIPKRIGIVPREHGRQRLVVHGLQRAQRYLVRHVPERILQFARHLVQSHEAGHGQEGDERPYPQHVGVLVHQERHGEYHYCGEERAELRMRKWERNVHDLPRHVVMHHPVAQELHQPTDDRRVHLPQTPVQVLSYYELLEPPQGHVGLGLRSPRLLQESNFGIRHAPEDEQRPSGVVFGSVFGQPIVSHPVTKYRE